MARGPWSTSDCGSGGDSAELPRAVSKKAPSIKAKHLVSLDFAPVSRSSYLLDELHLVKPEMVDTSISVPERSRNTANAITSADGALAAKPLWACSTGAIVGHAPGQSMADDASEGRSNCVHVSNRLGCSGSGYLQGHRPWGLSIAQMDAQRQQPPTLELRVMMRLLTRVASIAEILGLDSRSSSGRTVAGRVFEPLNGADCILGHTEVCDGGETGCH
ncbi:uncharacterized protein DSM5745_05620 [Aspergillus mulundensis]|uniref:Uncharacterized protein n=1 Tax=Aspergillus mulundensis TaxID=1810919 RepID=A0A3D8RXN5_9EURO|nr:hypothetical protein DSM5745_05620 [Aspergillus mulundensis]RDW78768.1 hypothetical protein DSM5745_05620 [Aspergillus mulundensis]